MTLELIIFIIFLFTELFEIYWQKSPTMMSMLEKIYTLYNKSPYLLYLMHPSFIFSMYLYYLSHYSYWILAIIVIKSIDIIFKVLLIHKHFIDKSLSMELKIMLEQPMHPVMLFMGISLYPYLLFLAIF